ncbi:MAG TPA: L-serine ammonia-lyase, iron-sulfur-dependent, subunit alpha [Candidatus Eisenbergiella merdipullorum]|uniref:UPF0597 protein H9717_07850 n=1 Tax=Candidatus Eisenbergiella merdipullorum TaxID=2838553 RepID=A0A9D2L137_9FIRM|nr:L-serine ammonia-lyase, iron-sulfur-dependent, subunit alpha [Candidatus Eisenbergiella merdipullorum]
MDKTDERYQAYLNILKSELVPAFGCTEPIAVAYAAACVRCLLGGLPEKLYVEASGNIIKNVKSVIVPNTGGMKGIEAAAAAGIISGREESRLEVLEKLTEADQEAIHTYLKNTPIAVSQAPGDLTFDLLVTGERSGHSARVRIAGAHTNVVLKELDGKVLLEKEIGSCYTSENERSGSYGPALTIEGIVDFASSVDTEDVKETLDRQIAYNTAISAEGLRGNYGANVGRVLLSTYGNDVKVRARAAAAAGSDARMNGCELPVVINSGSGNQGLTVSLPVIEYAKEIGADRERLYRALVISNLTSVHLKEGIGRLSAYCGAVTAGAGAGAGIAWLLGGGLDEIDHTIVNTLANVSGIICDGAKASCAAKIATSVEAGILGYYMYKNGQEFRGGDGIVKKGVEQTIENVARLGRDGMRETDKEILEMMIEM